MGVHEQGGTISEDRPRRRAEGGEKTTFAQEFLPKEAGKNWLSVVCSR